LNRNDAHNRRGIFNDFEGVMFRHFLRIATAVFVLLPAMASAEPIKLKLSFFSSNRSMSYIAAIKPFVDAVNAEAKGLVEIEVNFSGTLGKNIAQQPQLVLDGTADIAFVVPGYTSALFPDNGIVELPGLFRNMHEATLVYTELVARKALRGYENFFVIGAYITEPETIHGRVAINSIDDLKNKRIRSTMRAKPPHSKSSAPYRFQCRSPKSPRPSAAARSTPPPFRGRLCGITASIASPLTIISSTPMAHRSHFS
jgi:hypothetical protein